jgi:hypothetical protein
MELYALRTIQYNTPVIPLDSLRSVTVIPYPQRSEGLGLHMTFGLPLTFGDFWGWAHTMTVIP